MRKIIIFWLLLVFILFMLTACSGPPKLEEGERYYEGAVSFEYADSCTFSCVLEADGQNIRAARVNMKNWAFKYDWQSGGRSYSINEKTSNRSYSIAGKHPIDADGNVEILSREINVWLSFDSSGAHGEMEYNYKSESSDSNRIDISLGVYPFTMEDKTDAIGGQ